ncbi:tetratricopeptide repeat protein [Dactylosporangium sp. CA-139066]|uniref:tetratricopeptide repeat protein n=1 Tax=Dactylosporangium sp. CA-139066 TaxID=3239930 RepID=UPI003D8EFDCA
MRIGDPAEAPLRGTSLDVSLSVTAGAVRLCGPGVDVSAPHGGVLPGLSNALHDVRLERARSGVAVREVDSDQSGAGLVSLRRAGELLAESFLPAPVAAGLRGLVERAVREHVALRLAVEAPGLAWLPWEVLPDPVTGQPLALHPLVVVFRRSGGDVGVPGRLAGPLRIVVAIASPVAGGGPLLDYEHELRAVLAAVRQARRARGRVEVVPFATTAAIRAALNVPGGVHVLHISAHGKPGALILEDEEGRAREVTAEQLLVEAVPAGRMPPVISLAACYTDAAGEADGSSYAARLAAHGACAVIGTQTSVTDRYATLLFARVYAELAGSPGADVVQAVADARRMVQQELLSATSPVSRRLAGMDEWGVVTLQASAGAVPVVDDGLPVVAVPAARPTAWGPVEARPVGQFVGRRALQRRLPSVLDGDEYAGLVLHGIGGVGKTTLAAEVLRRTVQADPGWRVASLFGEVTVDGVLAEVAAVARRELLVRGQVAGLAAQGVAVAGRVDVPWRDRFEVLREHVLHEVRILVVLDNFEDNLTADGAAVADPNLAELLAGWATAPGGSRLLITSRYPLPLPGGRLLAQPLGPLSAAETGKLLWSLPHIDRHATDDPAVEQIWRVVGGHPRSLEYLDALLGHGEARFEDITARLADAAKTRLGPDQAGTWLVQDRTLDAALADTVTLAADDVLLTEHLNRLTTIPGAIDLLMAISVYREPIPTVALTFHIGIPKPADQVTADTDAREEQQQAAIEQIVGLLAAYDLTFDEMDAALDDGGPLTPAERDTLQDLFVAAARPPRSPYTEPAGLAELLDVLRYSSLIHHDPVDGVVFMHRWTATELHHRWQRTTTLDPGKDPIRRAHRTAAAYWQWRVTAWPQDPAADLHDLEEARHHLVSAGDLETAGAVTEGIGQQLESWGAWDRATSLIIDTLRWLPTDSPRRPAHLGQLGNLAHRRGDYAEAERRYQQSLAIFEELGDQLGLASCNHQLGMLAQGRGDHAEAERRYQWAIGMFEQLGEQAGQAAGHHQLGILAYLRGDDAEAGRRYERSLAIREQLGDQAGLALGYHQLGLLAQRRGDHAEAERRYQQSLAIFAELGDRASRAAGYHQLGILAHRRGDYTEAERRYRQSLAIKEQLGDQSGLATSYGQLGILAQDRGDHTEAERLYQRSLVMFEQLEDQAGVATNLSQLASVRIAGGDSAAAIPLYVRALSIRLALDMPQAAGNIEQLARIRGQIGDAAFAAAARRVVDGASYDNLVALLEAR